jgi:hypothetical protein
MSGPGAMLSANAATRNVRKAAFSGMETSTKLYQHRLYQQMKAVGWSTKNNFHSSPGIGIPTPVTD